LKPSKRTLGSQDYVNFLLVVVGIILGQNYRTFEQ